MSSVIKGAIYGIVFTIAMAIAAASYVLKMGYYHLVPAAQMAGMTASQAMLQKVKQRHLAKKAGLKAKVGKKAVSRAARSTAASLVGPVLIGAVTVGFVVEDYCSDMQELHEEDQLLNGKSGEYDYQKCMTDLKEDTKSWVSKAREESNSQLKSLRNEIEKKWKDLTTWLGTWFA